MEEILKQKLDVFLPFLFEIIGVFHRKSSLKSFHSQKNMMTMRKSWKKV